MGEKKLQYLLDFPTEEFKKELKSICAGENKTMKQFIISAVEDAMKKSKDRKWEEESEY